jgi:hypothetical protein
MTWDSHVGTVFCEKTRCSITRIDQNLSGNRASEYDAFTATAFVGDVLSSGGLGAGFVRGILRVVLAEGSFMS